jgi:Zn-dependent protease with chaperone function
MMNWPMALVLTFSSLALTVAVCSASMALGSSWFERRLAGRSPADRASALFRACIGPAAIASASALGVVLPLFLSFEPRGTQERIPVTLLLMSAAGAGLLFWSACRALRAILATRALSRSWRISGRRVTGFDVGLPVLSVADVFPTVAVVGIRRPVLVVAEQVLRECPSEEVRAMISHECAHVAARDNLKRLLLRACAVLPLPLVREWEQATEEAADAATVRDEPSRALCLAQALVHVARLAPAATVELSASAFYRGGSIEARVRRLLDDSSAVPSVSRRRGVVYFASALAGLLVIVSAPAIHQVMEVLVAWLP